jgi:hypothetical protein
MDYASPNRSAARRQNWLPLAGILMLALALRAALFAAACHNAPDLHTLNENDTPSYIAPAQSLLAHGTFSPDDAPEIVRTPGYPLLLTVGLRLGHVEVVTIALQIIISVASILLVYHLAWELTANSTAALASSALAALEPVSIIFTVRLLSETLFAFLLLASLSLLLRYLRTSSAIALVAAALTLAAATFVRPISYYLPPVIALLLLGRALTRTSPSGRAIGPSNSRLRETVLVMTFVAVCVAPLAAWQVRNYMLTGYSGFAAIADWNLYFYQGLSVVARQSGKNIGQMQSEMGMRDDWSVESLPPELRDAGQAAKFRYLKTEGIRLLYENPLTYAKIHASGTVPLVLESGAAYLLFTLDRFPEGGLLPLPKDLGGFLHRALHNPSQHCYLRLAFRVALGLVYCACALGLLVALRRLSCQWILVLATLAYFLAISGGPTGCARLRHPVMPIICALAGYGIAILLATSRRGNKVQPGSPRRRQPVPARFEHAELAPVGAMHAQG